jgi:cell wall-associated NlpC family hydrolase
MPDTDERPGTDRGGVAGRSGRRGGLRPGRRVMSACALAAVLGLVGFGTALGATPAPAPVAGTTPLGIGGAVATGSASVLGPLVPVPVDPAPVAGVRIGGTVATGSASVLGPRPPVDPAPGPAVALPLGTATAVSVPAPAVAPPPGPAPAPAPPGAGAPVPPGPAGRLRQAAFTTAAPDGRAGVAIRTALAQLGLPYVWGGNGPTNGDSGFDCSGLTTFSYGSAGVPLPRTAHTQYNAGPHVPGGTPLQPGDLLFYGTSARVHHVGMYLGAGRMVNAPTFGKPVQVAFYRYRGDDYLGATRPAAAGGSLTTGLLPYVDPVPVVPDVALAPAQREQRAQEQIFRAPTASLPAVLPQPGDAALPPEQESAARAVAESDAVAPAPVRPVAPPQVAGPGAPPPTDRPAPSGTTGSSTTAPAPVPSSAPAVGRPSAPAPAPVTRRPAGTATGAAPTTPPATRSPAASSPADPAPPSTRTRTTPPRATAPPTTTTATRTPTSAAATGTPRTTAPSRAPTTTADDDDTAARTAAAGSTESGSTESGSTAVRSGAASRTGSTADADDD